MNAGQNPSWRIGDILKWTAGFFEEKGVDSPRLTAEIMLAHVLGVSRLDLYLGYDKPLNQDERSRFRELVKRRASREPLAYIIGEKAFWKLDLEVSRSVLVPRPETELLVEAAVEKVRASDLFSRGKIIFADLGTGSGAIALSVLSELDNSFAVAVDRSCPALSLASRNSSLNHLSERISFIRSDWCSAFSVKFLFDFIVSNPPYIRTGVIPGLQPEVSVFEPREALDGGQDGLFCIRKIIGTAFDHIKPGGFLMMEIGYDQGDEAKKMIEKSEYCRNVEIIRDLSGNDRIVCAVKKD